MANTAFTLKSLLQEPYGPYIDSVILSPKCKSTPTRPVELWNLMLEHDGRPIGLTYSEHTQPECLKYYKTADSRIPVRLRGIIKIQHLDWLSEEGHKLLLKELKRRDYDARRKARNGHAEPSNLELKEIFEANGKLRNKKRAFKVVIQAEKGPPAVYMTSSVAPGSLVMTTINQNRQYKVMSMDSETYIRSRLFLSRYRVLYDLQTLVNQPRRLETRLKDRTPEWFVSQYMEYLVVPEDAEKSYGISRPRESSAALNDESEEAYLRPEKRNKLRHISRAEVLSMLAMHAKWLVQEQENRKRDRLFDPAQWGRFLREAHQYREQARKENLQWGTFRGEVTNFEEDTESESASDDGMQVDEPTPRTSLGKRKAPPSSRQHMGIRPPMAGPSTIRGNVFSRASPTVSETYSNRYDSDFTTDGSSSPGETDSESFPSRSPTPPYAATSNLPVEVLYAPTVPREGSWICPVRECLYEINFGRLDAQQREILGERHAQHISSGPWYWTDAVILNCFAKLVSDHYEGHMAACGVQFVKEGRKHKLKWTAPYRTTTIEGPVPEPEDTIVKEET